MARDFEQYLISYTEEEDDHLNAVYKKLSPEEQRRMMSENWMRFFYVTPFENDLAKRGAWVQATFWMLTKDMIRHVRFFYRGFKKNPLSVNKEKTGRYQVTPPRLRERGGRFCQRE